MSEDKFYISDTHFWHDNILTFDNRPYEDCMEMAVDMKRRWNEHVPTSAHVYILGDVTWKWGDYVKKYIQSLNGNKHLILATTINVTLPILKSYLLRLCHTRK